METDKLVAEGVIVPAERETGIYLHNISKTKQRWWYTPYHPQPQRINKFEAYHHIKMDTLEAAISMMKPGCFMVSVDLTDVYYTVPIISLTRNT